MQSHFLPCVLLKRFDDGAGRDSPVYVVRADDGTTRKQKVRKVAKENNLYALDDDLFRKAQADELPAEYRQRNGLEALLGDVEHAAGLSLDRIEASRILPTGLDDRHVFLWFLARLLCLNPRYMRHIHSMSGYEHPFARPGRR